MIRVMLAGGSAETRHAVARELATRLTLVHVARPTDAIPADEFVIETPPSTREEAVALDTDLARRGAEIEVVAHLRTPGADDAELVLTHYAGSIIEIDAAAVGSDLAERVIAGIREALLVS